MSDSPTFKKFQQNILIKSLDDIAHRKLANVLLYGIFVDKYLSCINLYVKLNILYTLDV